MGPQALQSVFVSPGFSWSLNLLGGRWPRPHSFRSPPSGRFGPSAQVLAEHTLPSCTGRAGRFRACAKTFRQFLTEKIASGELFRQPVTGMNAHAGFLLPILKEAALW